MVDYSKIIQANSGHWSKCEITPSRLREVMEVAARLVEEDAKFRYQAVETATGVRWYAVAVIHEREASQSWKTQLGQGDPLHEVSRNVPRGRGPFLDHDGDGPGHDAWHRSALDALIDCPPFASRWKDWTPGGTLTLLELYNGIGYELYHHESSPYVWASTTQQQRGKYTGDGDYDASAWDNQLGCAAMLKGMIQLDKSIVFDE